MQRLRPVLSGALLIMTAYIIERRIVEYDKDKILRISFSPLETFEDKRLAELELKNLQTNLPCWGFRLTEA